ncbi:MAG TPA: AI-2E family transporter, partial [Candidatus Binatia bacterium]|nr:AI-2E family transporter [Candidatus Binatia bacterium]
MKQPPDRRLDFHTIPGTAKLPWWIFLPGLVLIIAILYWAQAVLIPVALSILLTFLLSPLVDALEQIRLGRVVSVILVVVLAFTVLAGMGWILAYQVTSLADDLPKYRNNITQKVADLRGLGKGGVAEKVQETVEEVKEEINRADKTATKKDKPRPVVVEAEGSSTFWPIPLATGP